jgi:hypothetical protein
MMATSDEKGLYVMVLGGSVMVLGNEKSHVVSLQMPNDDNRRSQQ